MNVDDIFLAFAVYSFMGAKIFGRYCNHEIILYTAIAIQPLTVF